MPYRWNTETGEAPEVSGASLHADGGPPLARLDLSAHNSLSPGGFVIFFGATFGLVLVPLLAVVGSPVLWALLPFVGVAMAAMWWALKRSWADKSVTEALLIWSDHVELSHVPARGPRLSWQANTYWVRPQLHALRGPLKAYITLRGSPDGREVELGSFLSEEERRVLFADLARVLSEAARSVPPP